MRTETFNLVKGGWLIERKLYRCSTTETIFVVEQQIKNWLENIKDLLLLKLYKKSAIQYPPHTKLKQKKKYEIRVKIFH